MAHSQPWILHPVAGPALDQELFAPSAAASATSLLRGKVTWQGVVAVLIGVQHRPRHVAMTKLASGS